MLFCQVLTCFAVEINCNELEVESILHTTNYCGKQIFPDSKVPDSYSACDNFVLNSRWLQTGKTNQSDSPNL